MGDVSTSKSLVYAGDLVNIILAVLVFLVLVVFTLGLGLIIAWIPPVIAFWTHGRVKEALELIDEGRYKEAKDKLLVPAILSLLFNSLIGGILILIGAIMLPEENPGTEKEEVRTF